MMRRPDPPILGTGIVWRRWGNGRWDVLRTRPEITIAQAREMRKPGMVVEFHPKAGAPAYLALEEGTLEAFFANPFTPGGRGPPKPFSRRVGVPLRSHTPQ